jgi:tetratricopeptide (TPR) repeat protein
MFMSNKSDISMNSFLFISRIKNLLIILTLIAFVVACNSGGEKSGGTASGNKQPEQKTTPAQTEVTTPSNQSPPVTAQGGQTQGSQPGATLTMKGPDPNAPHQTMKLNPVSTDPKSPKRNLLDEYAKNKVNSIVIPFKKGEDDPDLKASRGYYTSGTQKAKQGDHVGAIEDFTKSIELVRNATVYMMRGYSYMLTKDYESAIIDMNEAIKMAPVLDKAYFARAVCRFEMQDFKLAEEDFRKYMETDKTNALAYNYLAAIKFMQKNFKEALDYYTEVSKLDPAFPDIYTNRGMMRHNLGDLKGAILDYDLAIKNDASNSTAYNNKGAAELTLKEYPAALKDLSMAIQLKQDYADAYDNRGKVKLKMGDQQGACDDWQKAYSLGLEASRDLIMKFCK